MLDQEIPYYNWTGFYFRNGDKEELVLGPYVGAETDHTVIPFGKGICGQVAVSGETFVVPDVYSQDNYLSCSIDTKSEIVVPIFKDGKTLDKLILIVTLLIRLQTKIQSFWNGFVEK